MPRQNVYLSDDAVEHIEQLTDPDDDSKPYDNLSEAVRAEDLENIPDDTERLRPDSDDEVEA